MLGPRRSPTDELMKLGSADRQVPPRSREPQRTLTDEATTQQMAALSSDQKKCIVSLEPRTDWPPLGFNGRAPLRAPQKKRGVT
jgi:hypothetical protein